MTAGRATTGGGAVEGAGTGVATGNGEACATSRVTEITSPRVAVSAPPSGWSARSAKRIAMMI